jgi:hypothetical protein
MSVIMGSSENLTSTPGNYAVSTIKTRPWLSTTVKQTTNKTRKSKTQIVIANPIFNECASVVQDPFWVGVFQKASLGKLPRGFTYKEGYLIHKRGTRVNRIEVPNAPAEASSVCISFFGKMAGLMSPNDHERNRQLIGERLQESFNNQMASWSVVSKKKKLKELLIATFIDELAVNCQITYDEKLELISLINKGFILGYFTSKNIQFESGRILSIAGLECHNQVDKNGKVRKIFTIDPAIKGRIKKSNTKPSKKRRVDQDYEGDNDEEESETEEQVTTNRKKRVNFLDLWEKFLDNLEKRMFVPKEIQIVDENSSQIDHSDIITSETSDMSAIHSEHTTTQPSTDYNI